MVVQVNRSQSIEQTYNIELFNTFTGMNELEKKQTFWNSAIFSKIDIIKGYTYHAKFSMIL